VKRSSRLTFRLIRRDKRCRKDRLVLGVALRPRDTSDGPELDLEGREVVDGREGCADFKVMRRRREEMDRRSFLTVELLICRVSAMAG
jgi:hypothetical protein